MTNAANHHHQQQEHNSLFFALALVASLVESTEGMTWDSIPIICHPMVMP